MILLEGQTLNQRNWFRPESFQLQLGERDSNATITVGPDVPEITVGAWMMDDTEPGKGIVWRVKGVDTNFREETRTISLEHVIQTLKDTVMFGEVSTSQLGGGSAKKAVQYILGKQSIWTLGDFEYDLSAPFEFNSDTLLDALEEISSALADNVWEYDLTALPFKLHIRQQNNEVKCEMRGGRNISSIQKSIDKSRMYTRLYPIGKDNLHISGNYIEQNTDLYGVICKVETDQAYDTNAKLRKWAEDRLRRHCEPTVTITISGLELSQETGESLDHLLIGTVCRVPVPELGVLMAEKITRLQWKDKIKDPRDVTVTLANNREDVATIFKNEAKTAAKSGRTGAKVSGSTKGLIEDTAKGLYTHIDQTAEHIRLEAADTKKELQAAIEINADKISMVVEGTGNNKHIKAASIVASINDAGSEVVISASHIALEGNVDLNSVMSVTGNYIRMKKPVVVDNNYLQCSELRLRSGSSGVTLSESNMEHVIVSASVSGNVLTLTPMRGEPINFSKATTLTGAWNGSLTAGKSYKVEARQAGSSTPVATHFSPALDGYYTGSRRDDGSRHYLPVTVYDEKGTDLYRDEVDVTSVWNAGASSVPSYSQSAVLTFVRFDDDYEEYIYRSEDLITRESAGATKTVHYN